MSRINTNVNSLISQRILKQQNQGLTKSLERLSTGLAINRGSDNPAGLIASERLRSEKASITAAIGNAERADQIVNIAEGGLQEVNSLLLELQSLVSETANEAGLSADEKEANQLQVDAILQTIDRIASTTSFQGTKLLNGNYDFTVSAQSSTVASFRINGAKLGSTNQQVDAIVTQSAQHAGLFLSVGGSTLDFGGDADGRFVIEVAGTLGTRQFSFASGTTTSAVARSINTFKSVTGISAVASGNGISLKSSGFGSSQFVSVDVVDDGGQGGNIVQLASTNENGIESTLATNFSAVTNAIRDEGQDLGIIVNGVTARGNGKTGSVNADQLNVDFELTTSAAQAVGTYELFTVTGGGAEFNLGPTVDIGNQVRLGIQDVSTRKLGSTQDEDDITRYLDELGSGKELSLIDGDLTTGQAVVNKAINEIASLRGRLGSFQKNVVGSTINALSVTFENVSAAESTIRDTDFAAETAKLTRNQILVNAATNVLSISNAQPQSVLGLLG
jgi:flagellin